MPKRSRSRTEPVREGIAPLVLAALVACGVALVVGAVLLFAAAAVAVGREDPDALVAPLGYGVAAVASLLAGFLTAHRAGRAPLVCGLIAAALLGLVTALCGLLLPGECETAPTVILALHAAMAALTVGGAYLGRRRPKRRTK